MEENHYDSFSNLLELLPENIRGVDSYRCPHCHTDIKRGSSPSFMNVLSLCPACGGSLGDIYDFGHCMDMLEDDFQNEDGTMKPHFVAELIAFLNIALSNDMGRPYISDYIMQSYGDTLVVSWIEDEGHLQMKSFKIK